MDNKTYGLVRTHKFAVFSEIATSFVHEMKNPISAITLGMEFLDMNLDEQNSQRDTIKNIYKSSEKLNYLLDNLLLYYQNGSSQSSPIKLSQLAEQSLSLTNYYTNRNQIKVMVSAPENEPWISLKASQIMQALVYLTVWSTKRMPQGGNIILNIRPVGNVVALSLRDNGPALTLQQRQGLTDPCAGGDPGPGIALLLMKENGAEIEIPDGSEGQDLITAKFRISN